jgi:hypothetical protein
MPWYDAGRTDPQDSTFEPPLAAPPVLTDVAPPQPVAERRAAAPVIAPAAAPAQRATPAVPAMPPVAAPLLASEAVAVAPHGGPGRIDLEPPDGALAQPAPRHSASGALRVETLAATLEEVEFLSSLGLTSDAMDVLKTYLQDSASPAPLAFFELMRLCDQAEDAAAVATVRRRYTQAFGVEAPRLEQVNAGIGLDSLKDLSARVTAAWGKPAALDLIEEALFTVPRPGAALTLQAGRDLVCLYDLALALGAEGAAAVSAEDDAHPLAPWANAADAQAAHALAQDFAEAGGDHFALDVDLTAAPDALPEPQDAAFPDLELAPLVKEMQEQARREAALRAAAEEEDAFSAAVASERAPITRY